MTWFIEDKRTWAQKTFGQVLKSGPLPKHVAIIMDGNRRFARNRNIEKIEGHISGFEKLAEALNWCFTINVEEVTVYAFSIENFKRSKDEVSAIFDLAREKFKKLLEEKEKIDKLGVCIRIFGELKMLPLDLQQLVSKVMKMTRKNTNLHLNVCFAYTAREEMTIAIRDICQGIRKDQINLCDVDDHLLEKSLYTSHSHDVDLLVRTSGEVRLSDFLLWQSNASVLSFVNQLWPEFSIWNFYMAIVNYQLNYSSIKKMNTLMLNLRQREIEALCKMVVVENRKLLVNEVKKQNDDTNDLTRLARHVASEAISKCTQQHEKRTSSFLTCLYDKRNDLV